MEIETTTVPAINSVPTPFRLSTQAIKDFQATYFEKHHVHISDEEANRQGIKLLRLVKAVYRPFKNDLGGKPYGK